MTDIEYKAAVKLLIKQARANKPLGPLDACLVFHDTEVGAVVTSTWAYGFRIQKGYRLSYEKLMERLSGRQVGMDEFNRIVSSCCEFLG